MDDDQFSTASIDENLRRLEEQRQQQEAEAEQRRQEIANSKQGQGSNGFSNGLNNASNYSQLAASGGLGEITGAGMGGAGSVTGGSALAGGEGAAAYGGGQASTVLPGIFGGSSVGSGATAGASGVFGGGVAGGSAGGGAAAGGGAYGGIAAAGPWAALAAAIVGHNQWAKGQGLRDNEKFPLQTGLEGRALYKDSKRYQEWGERILPGLGDGARMAGIMSSPTEMVKGKNIAEFAKLAAKGGVLVQSIKKLFD